MSKPSRKPKKRQQKAEKKRKYSNLNFSGLDAHVRQGTKLEPPFNRLDKMVKSSWQDDHMPEMLWAVLLTEVLPRRDYLGCFRAIINVCSPWFSPKDSKSGDQHEAGKAEIKAEIGISYTLALDHTKLAELSDEKFHQFVSIPLKHPLGYAALRPLLLLSSIPRIERWKAELDVEPTSADWQTLAQAVAEVLDHQSEKSTDIRWFKLMLPIAAGMMFFAKKMEEEVKEVYEFPDRGDMKSVRPFIRSGEMTLRRSPPSKWIDAFWAECSNTQCIDPTPWPEKGTPKPFFVSPRILFPCREAVIARFLMSLTPARVDPRLDCSFGLVLYALSIVQECVGRRLQQSISGRLGLRALAEVNITLRYLASKDSSDLWKSYRVYGAGQAKLAFLKAQEADAPPFLDEEILHQISNEDVWQEFLTIDIGHWDKSNLRTMAEQCGAKGTYDKYYVWTSAYIHGHWGAVRDTNFLTCHNPLHRLHRIPRILHRELPSIAEDAVALVNEMIAVLDKLYPSDDALLQLKLADDEPGKAESVTS